MSKVTVITGGTSGIGRGIVEKILANSEDDDLIFATYAHNSVKANEFWDSLKPEDQEKLIIMKADGKDFCRQTEILPESDPRRRMDCRQISGRSSILSSGIA